MLGNYEIITVAVLAHKIWGHGPMASAVARAYNGGLKAEPPAGSRGRDPGQGVKGFAPEAEAFLVFGRLMEAAKFPTFRNFEKTKASDICVIFAKKSWMATKLEEGLEQN